MSVMAKMQCIENSAWEGDEENRVVRLQAVYDPNDLDGNKSWTRWTPSGELRLQITNPEAFNQFKVGVKYIIHFSPAE